MFEMFQKLRHAVQLLAFITPVIAYADTITLKSSLRVSGEDQVITLSDIAELEGAKAWQFADIPILDTKSLQGPEEISIQEVRSLLNDAGAHWGLINLNGHNVIVRPALQRKASAPMAMTPVTLDSPPDSHSRTRKGISASQVIHDNTLRGSITRFISDHLKIDADDLKLGFDNNDEQFLDQQLNSARFEIQPRSNIQSDRIELTIREWENGTVKSSKAVSVVPTIQTQTVVLQRNVPRNEIIHESDIEITEQWLPPSQKQFIAHPVVAIGRSASKSLKAGSVVRISHLHKETIIRRGDLVTVRCLVGGVAISLQAEAREDGALGESLEFRKQGERDTFLATVSAPGEAVLDLSNR